MIFPPSELLTHFEWDEIEHSKAVYNMYFPLSIKQPVQCRQPLSNGMCWQSSLTKEGGLRTSWGLRMGMSAFGTRCCSFQLPSSAVLWSQLRTYSENAMVLPFPQLRSQSSRGPRFRNSEVILDHSRARREMGSGGDEGRTVSCWPWPASSLQSRDWDHEMCIKLEGN